MYAFEDWELPRPEPEKDEKEATSDEAENKIPEKVETVEDYRIRQPCILIFDSLGGESHTKVLATLREYLQEEFKVL